MWGFPCSSVGKESACSAGYLGSIRGLGKSPGEGNGNPLQYPCLENLMDRGAWWAAVHGVGKSWARLSDLTHVSLCVEILFCLPIHLAGRHWVISTFWQWWITQWYKFVYEWSECQLAILLGIHPGVKWLGHPMFKCFENMPPFLPQLLHYFTVQSAVHRGSDFSTPSPSMFSALLSQFS